MTPSAALESLHFQTPSFLLHAVEPTRAVESYLQKIQVIIQVINQHASSTKDFNTRGTSPAILLLLTIHAHVHLSQKENRHYATILLSQHQRNRNKKHTTNTQTRPPSHQRQTIQNNQHPRTKKIPTTRQHKPNNTHRRILRLWRLHHTPPRQHTRSRMVSSPLRRMLHRIQQRHQTRTQQQCDNQCFPKPLHD